MEQLIPVIEFVKKHKFWLICGMVSIASFVTWYLAAGSLAQSREKSIKSISSMQTTAQGITRVSASGVEDTSVRAHPNESTKAGMEKQIEGAAAALIRVWQVRRKEQEGILKWPADVIPEEASKFIEVYKQFDPPEAFPGLANQDMGQWLGVYKQNIPKRMVTLCDVIGTKWDYDEFGQKIQKETEDPSGRMSEEEGMMGMGPKVDVPEELPVVVWSEDNQALWNSKLTDFKGRDGQAGLDNFPTPIQVIMLQQDLWLLEAMFAIIKDLNGDADANDVATIKQIFHLAFGRDARSQLGVLTEPNPKLMLAGLSANGEESEFENFPAETASDPEEVFDPYPGEGNEQLGPFHGRYVDKNFKPLTATQVQEILKGKSFPAENLELLVAKRVPVRIALKMDERKIDDFIAACANSPFAFEIWQVRVNRPLDPIQLGGSFENTAAASAPDTEDLRASTRSFLPQAQTGGGSDKKPTAGFISPHRRSNYDTNVEFYGIVKIYNPVNEELILNPSGDPAP